MSWIKVYNKGGDLKKSFRIDTKGEIQSSYVTDGNVFFRFNLRDKKKSIQFKVLKDSVYLLEGGAEYIFYRYIKRSSNKNLEIPECLYNLEIENKMILNFNISKNKLNAWKQIMKK